VAEDMANWKLDTDGIAENPEKVPLMTSLILESKDSKRPKVYSNGEFQHDLVLLRLLLPLPSTRVNHPVTTALAYGTTELIAHNVDELSKVGIEKILNTNILLGFF